MTQSSRLSLWAVLLINVNIMLGSGIFINTVLLGQNAGPLSPLVYALVGICFFPLIASVAQLMTVHKGGTFYDFGASLHPALGFVSSWSYFTTKIASAALSIHVFATLIQQIFPPLASISVFFFDTAILSLFIWLNSFNLRMGSRIQFSFIFLKMIPLFFAIIAGYLFFQPGVFTGIALPWASVPLSFPLVIFAFSGFEASCSLSQSLENPEKNGPKALFMSYGLVLTMVMLYQCMFYGALGEKFALLTNFKEAFPALVELFKYSQPVQTFLIVLLHLGIAFSALGASYGILYSNAWNLHALAKNNHIPAKSFFTQLNAHGVPFGCILTEGFLAFIYLLITQAQQVPLQQLSALGAIIAYTVSVLALLRKAGSKSFYSRLAPLGALISCTLFASSLLYAYFSKGALSLAIFTPLFLVGLMSYRVTQKK